MARERDEKGRFKRTGGKAAAGQSGSGKTRKGGSANAGGARAKSGMKKKHAVFFRELAMFCNVSEALRKAGLASQSSAIYTKRLEDPAFRARWEAAIEQSVALLDLEILERGRFGDDRPPPRTEVEKRLREVPTGLALQLLKLHHGRAKARGAVSPAAPAAAPRRMTRRRAREIRVELERLLDEFSRRMSGEG